jgi:L-aminopeptidase/D-esterase-like protein
LYAPLDAPDHAILVHSTTDCRHQTTAESECRIVRSPLFAATADATEEAIYNAILRATTVTIERGTLEAISIEEVLRRILEEYNVLEWDDSTAPGGN